MVAKQAVENLCKNDIFVTILEDYKDKNEI